MSEPEDKSFTVKVYGAARTPGDQTIKARRFSVTVEGALLFYDLEGGMEHLVAAFSEWRSVTTN